ncbi:MAG: glycine zipper 2TM domain-containing protein [Burkholderiaceae bacterium]
MKNLPLSAAVSVCALALLSACSSPGPRNESIPSSPGVVYNSPGGGSYNASILGNVTQIEVIPVASRSSGAGAVIGGILGAVVGNQVGGGTGRVLATGVGAVGGAYAGNEYEKSRKSDTDIYRVSVRFDNGASAQYDYQRVDNLRVGDRVKVENNQIYRF